MPRVSSYVQSSHLTYILDLPVLLHVVSVRVPPVLRVASTRLTASIEERRGYLGCPLAAREHEPGR